MAKAAPAAPERAPLAAQSLHVAGRGNVRVDALVGSATAAGVRKNFVNLLQMPFASLMNALVPRAPVVPALEAEKLSKNPAVVRAPPPSLRVFIFIVLLLSPPPPPPILIGARPVGAARLGATRPLRRRSHKRAVRWRSQRASLEKRRPAHRPTSARARADPAVHRRPQALQGLRARVHRVRVP